MGFWPYFLHEYSSGGMSAVLELIAGTLVVFFTRCFLERPIDENNHVVRACARLKPLPVC